MTTVKVIIPGTPKWAETIAIRIVAEKYHKEVAAIKTEIMFAYAQGYQDSTKDKETIQSQEGKATK